MHKSFYSRITENKIKTYVLIFFFILFISLLGYLFGALYADPFIGLFFAIIVSTIFALIGFYSGPDMVLAASHAKKVEKKDYPHYYNSVEGLCIAAGNVPMPKLYVIEESSINAFATGRDPNNSMIAVTTGALKKLNREELEGVLAHELSHIKNYDIRIMMITTILVGTIALLGDIMLRSMFFSNNDRDNNFGIIGIVIAVVLAILSPFIAKIIQLAISRQREYLADSSAAQLTRHPRGLASALEKIKKDVDPVVDTANKATAHLYIENPLRHSKGFINSLFSTHPDINDRIKRLNQM